MHTPAARHDLISTSVPKWVAVLALLASRDLILAQAPGASAVAAEIRAHGARAVVSRLIAAPAKPGESAWDRLTQEIWLGRAEYIALAPKLAEGTDAGTSEDLGISLAHALPLAPASVLRAMDLKVDAVLGLKRVCGVPFIEDTVEDLPGYVRAAKQALGKVSDAALLQAKAACLVELRAASERIANH